MFSLGTDLVQLQRGFADAHGLHRCLEAFNRDLALIADDAVIGDAHSAPKAIPRRRLDPAPAAAGGRGTRQGTDLERPLQVGLEIKQLIARSDTLAIRDGVDMEIASFLPCVQSHAVCARGSRRSPTRSGRDRPHGRGGPHAGPLAMHRGCRCGVVNYPLAPDVRHTF